MSKPTRITPHIHGIVTLPSTGFGGGTAQAMPVNTDRINPGVIRSTGRITTASAHAARQAAAERLRSNSRRVLVVG